MKPSILFVDDEPSIRQTVPMILTSQGFDVTTASNVADALGLIGQKHFDILLTDLNIGEPNDGLLLVGAMRRAQPKAATVIITGYPGFESALRTIQIQVDDYLIKPAHPTQLINTLRRVHENRPLRQQNPLVRLFDIVSEKRDEILRQWLSDIEASPEARRLRMSPEERSSCLPLIIDAVIELHRHPGDEGILSTGEKVMFVSSPAKQYGANRREQGYWASLLADEIRLLDRIILLVIEQNLIRVDLAYLFKDLQALNNLLGILLRESIRSFLDEPVVLA